MTTSKRQSHNKTRRVGSEPNLGQKAAEQEKKSKAQLSHMEGLYPERGDLNGERGALWEPGSRTTFGASVRWKENYDDCRIRRGKQHRPGSGRSA